MEGSVEVTGQISYASQEPWVFSGTLRDNILLGKVFEMDRYQSVLEACALDKVCLTYVNQVFLGGGGQRGAIPPPP